MNVYLLPHHRLDPRFQYTLEREAALNPRSAAAKPKEPAEAPSGWWRRQAWRLRNLLRKLKVDYDHVVHGHEQIRLSRLLMLMDRDPELTLVIPADMTRDAAMEAVRGVIRAGQMALRSHAVRNVSTTVLMFIILFLILPLHFTAIIFLPLLILYGWLRFWEDRLIRRIMTHLLEVRLAGDRGGRFREEVHLAHLERIFSQSVRPNDAYHEATTYLDSLDQKFDGLSAPEHLLMFSYYQDIGRLDAYERYQDRIRKRLGEALKLVVHHLWTIWKSAFRWSFATTRLAGVRLPNLLFILLGAVGTAYGAIEFVEWKTKIVETLPKYVWMKVEFPKQANISIEAWPLAAQRSRGTGDSTDATPGALFSLTCPADSNCINLWPVISEMIAKHEKNRDGRLPCTGSKDESDHTAKYEIHIKY